MIQTPHIFAGDLAINQKRERKSLRRPFKDSSDGKKIITLSEVERRYQEAEQQSDGNPKGQRAVKAKTRRKILKNIKNSL